MRIVAGSTDQYLYFVALDSTDFVTRKTGLSSFTVYRSRNGGTPAAMTTPTVIELDAVNMPGVYALLMDEDIALTGDDETEEMTVHITATGMAPVTRSVEIFSSAGGGGDAPTAAEVADAVWDEALSGHVTAGSAGKGLGDVLAAVDTEIAAIKAKTDNLPTDPADASVIAGRFDTLDTNLATVDGVVDAIKAKTDNLPTDPADHSLIIAAISALNNLSGGDVADAVWDALTADHDTADTFGALVGAAPSAADVADAVWDELLVDHDDAGSFGAQANTVSSRVDTAISTRLASASYTAPDNAGITALAAAVADLPTNAELAAALAGADDAVLAVLAAIKAQTDLLPESPADSGHIPSAAAIRDAVFAQSVESHTFLENLVALEAMLVGRWSKPDGDDTMTWRNKANTRDVIVAEVTDEGRTITTVDLIP